jgi:hypothetical protein
VLEGRFPRRNGRRKRDASVGSRKLDHVNDDGVDDFGPFGAAPATLAVRQRIRSTLPSSARNRLTRDKQLTPFCGAGYYWIEIPVYSPLSCNQEATLLGV